MRRSTRHRIVRGALLASWLCGLSFHAGGCTQDFDSLFGQDDPDGATGSGGVSGAGGTGGTGGDSGGRGGGSGDAALDAPVDGSDAGSAYATLILSHSPIAYYRLGESSGPTAADMTGNYPGVYEGAVGLSQPGAIVGDPDTCARFDENDARVMVEDTQNVLDFDGTDPFTLEAWVKQDPSPVPTNEGRHHFLSKYDNGLPVSQQIGFDLQLKSGAEGGPPAFIFIRKQGSTSDLINTPITAPAEWHYIAGVYDGSEIRLYIDDLTPEVHSATMPIADTTVPLIIGNSAAGSTWFGGLVDEVAIYDVALTETQLAAHYNAGKGRSD